MIEELWKNINSMDIDDVEKLVFELNSKTNKTIKENLELSFGLFRLEYIDKALFHIQMIYYQSKKNLLNNEFVNNTSGLKKVLMSSFNIWEDACGNIHVEEGGDDCGNGCCTCCSSIGCLLCCGGSSELMPSLCGCECFTPDNTNGFCWDTCNSCCISCCEESGCRCMNESEPGTKTIISNEKKNFCC